MSMVKMAQHSHFIALCSTMYIVRHRKGGGIQGFFRRPEGVIIVTVLSAIRGY
jgi:hypothetical protein